MLPALDREMTTVAFVTASNLRKLVLVFACPLLAAAVPHRVRAQEPDGTVRVTVRSGEAPVADATVRAGAVRVLTSAEGRATLRLRPGPRLLVIAKVGYHPDSIEVVVRAGADTSLGTSLTEEAEELEEITVQATRSTRHVEDEPTRVEILAGADVAEKTSMRPQDLTNFVSEMSGVRIQPTAPGRGGAAIRIQGMRGQYTQVLNDGLPLAGSIPSGLLLLQMPPVDLQQVEVIKGAATALYGPGALGGVMNLVSRRPDNRTDLVLSARGPLGGDGFLWTSRQLGERTGLSLTADAHAQDDRDRDADSWMDLPGYTRFGVRPRFYWTGPHGASLLATAGVMAENRLGGTMEGGLAPDGQPWDNAVDTRRFDAGIIGQLPLGGGPVLHYRASWAHLRQDARYGPAVERGHNTTWFGEASLAQSRGRFDGVMGVAWNQSMFESPDLPLQDYTFTTPSLFAQVTWTPAPKFSTTLAGRCDAHNKYGDFCSPRLSLLYRLAANWSLRLSGGTGFFAPTPFTEETEPIGLTPVAPLNVEAERGQNASFDLAGLIGKVELTATLFANDLKHAVTLEQTPAAAYPTTLVNAPGPARTSGGEIFAVYDVAPVVITAFYAYLWASEVDPASGLRHEAARNPRHNFFVDLAWETHTTWIALEVNWIGQQALQDDPYRTRSANYANVELLVSRTMGPLTLYANADNLTNVRQTRYAPLLRPTRQAGESWTVGQWAPVEGRLVSVGMRYRL